MTDKIAETPPTTEQLVKDIKKSDKRANRFLKISIILAVIFIITSLSFLIYQNIRSDNEIKGIQKNLTAVIDKQSEELNQIKKSQATNSAIYKTQFAAIEAILQQQNTYLKCLTTSGGPECVQPVFPADTITGPSSPQTQPEQAQNSPQTKSQPNSTSKPSTFQQVMKFLHL